MGRRADALELAVLGLLQESPLHGYKLRKRLNSRLGAFRALSFGTLYPCLGHLTAKGWIRQGAASPPAPGKLASRRGRIVYEITDAGLRRLADLLAHVGPATWEDDTFDVYFSFFARTDTATRLRILEGRRTRMQERVAVVQQAMERSRDRQDSYTRELHRHGLDSAEREVLWLDSLIEHERSTRAVPPPNGARVPEPSSRPDQLT